MKLLRTTRLVGFLLIFIGVVVNKWTLYPFAPDGTLSSRTGLLFLFAFQLPAILAGAVILLKPASTVFPSWLSLALLITSITFSISVAEFTLSRFYKLRPRAFVGEFENRTSKNFVADPSTGWRMRPNITEFLSSIRDGHRVNYRSNKQGFRSQLDFDQATSPNRIVLVGDSFTFGTGVEIEETFGALLNAQLGDDVAVYNLAMPGFGLDQMWMSVRHQALPMKPTLIIMGFIDQDLDRSLTAYRLAEGFNKPTFELDGKVLRPQGVHDKPNGAIRFLERYSVIWNLLKRISKVIGHSVPFGDWWLRNEAILKAVIGDCRSSGVSILFVRLPLKSWGEFPNLHRLMASEEANLLDLGSQKMRPPYDVHFRTDGHINKAGHQFVANELLRWLSKNFPKAFGQENKSLGFIANTLPRLLGRSISASPQGFREN
jgi:hypothetical protein